jgi:5'-nucleotidase
MIKRPLIFVTNDDGIFSKGIRSLIEIAEQFGEIVIIAPDKPQSGMGHAITLHQPLRLEKDSIFNKHESYTCSGTPVDCVKLGISEIMKRKPDLLLSGINHGDNSSTNILYSGTMSAAVEGAMENIPSIGFSLCDFDADADFTAAKTIASKIIKAVLSNEFPANICLNVNIPKLPAEEIKGIKIVTQADAYWQDRFEKRVDQFNKPYYWLTGEFGNTNPLENTDTFALKNGYVSIVPTQYDLTSYRNIEKIKDWGIDL